MNCKNCNNEMTAIKTTGKAITYMCFACGEKHIHYKPIKRSTRQNNNDSFFKRLFKSKGAR